MGCSISRLELRGRGKEPTLLSFKHNNIDDVSRKDRSILSNNSQSLSAKFLLKQIIGRNSVSVEKKDFVLGGSNELLLPEKEGPKDPPSLHLPNEHTQKPSLHDPHYGLGAAENTRVEAVKQTKTNNHVDEESEERGVVLPKFDGPLWIASPSFRDYCNVVPDGDSDDDNNNNNTVIAKAAGNRSIRENLAHSTKDIEITHGDNINDIQRDDSPGRLVKTRRNFRKVLTMHRQPRVKNFFSVATCYNPLTTSAQNGPRKPQGKTV